MRRFPRLTLLVNAVLIVAAIWVYALFITERDPYGLGLLLLLVAFPIVNGGLMLLRVRGRGRSDV